MHESQVMTSPEFVRHPEISSFCQKFQKNKPWTMDEVARGTVQWIERAAGAAVATVSQSVHHLITTTNSSSKTCDRSSSIIGSGRDPLGKATDMAALGAVAAAVVLVGTVQYGTSMDPIGRCWRFWKQLNRQVRVLRQSSVDDGKLASFVSLDLCWERVVFARESLIYC
jgi:hypothetical protein